MQVRYLGMAGTTGADFFDYIITDQIVTPKEQAPFYSERFIYMPDSYQVNSRREIPLIQTDGKKDLGLPDAGFVFGSFATNYKLDQDLFSIWLTILTQVPGSVLWLLERSEGFRENIIKSAQKGGVSPSRIIFAPMLPRSEHLRRLAYCDLILDTISVNGAATTSDALWVDVPVLTLMGNHFASRMSSSILKAVGLEEMITHSLLEYEAKAVQLAQNSHLIKALKEKLGKNKHKAPLFDTRRFTGHLEKAYEKIWGHYCSGKDPEIIYLTG